MLLRAFQGDPAAADLHEQQAVQLGEQVGHMGNLVNLLHLAALRHLIDRNRPRAVAVTQRMVALTDEYGMAFWSALALALKGAALAATEPEPALALIRINRKKLEAARAFYLHPILLCFEAEALIGLRRLGEAEQALDEAHSHADRSGCCWWDPELHRMGAMLARDAGDVALAKEELLRAVEIAESQGSEGMRRRAAAELAEVT